jgi:predicted nucleic acid-binding Zn ribbon protein
VRRLAPRPIGLALDRVAGELAPETPLARVQAAWAAAVGEANAAHGTPIRFGGGRLTVYCPESGWAENLQLMGLQIAARLNAELGDEIVREIRCTSRAPRDR